MGMPWNQIKAMRNIVAHNYGNIDIDVLWDTVQYDIPSLKKVLPSVYLIRSCYGTK